MIDLDGQLEAAHPPLQHSAPKVPRPLAVGCRPWSDRVAHVVSLFSLKRGSAAMSEPKGNQPRHESEWYPSVRSNTNQHGALPSPSSPSHLFSLQDSTIVAFCHCGQTCPQPLKERRPCRPCTSAARLTYWPALSAILARRTYGHTRPHLDDT